LRYPLYVLWYLQSLEQQRVRCSEVGGSGLQVALRLGKSSQIQLGAGLFEAGLYGGKGLERLGEVGGRLCKGATRLGDAAQGALGQASDKLKPDVPGHGQSFVYQIASWRKLSVHTVGFAEQGRHPRLHGSHAKLRPGLHRLF
jgi:hypothetical protein